MSKDPEKDDRIKRTERAERTESADAELTAWRGEWQALGGKDDLALQLVARAAKDSKRMRRSATGEVLACAFSSAVSFWLIIRSHGAADVVAMTGFILLFNGAWLTHFFTLRADLFGTSGNSVDAFVTLTRRRLAAERRWTRIARRWTLAICAALVPWGIWVLIGHREAYLAAPWRAIVGFGTAAVILAGVLIVMRRKERKVIAEEEAFERHVADVELA